MNSSYSFKTIYPLKNTNITLYLEIDPKNNGDSFSSLWSSAGGLLNHNEVLQPTPKLN